MSTEFFKTSYKIEKLAVSFLQIQFTQLAILLEARYRVHNGLKSCLFSLDPCLFMRNFLNIKKYFKTPPQIVGRYKKMRISLHKKRVSRFELE